MTDTATQPTASLTSSVLTYVLEKPDEAKLPPLTISTTGEQAMLTFKGKIRADSFVLNNGSPLVVTTEPNEKSNSTQTNVNSSTTQWSNGSSGAISYSGGNVGIGITSPSSALHVGSAKSVRFELGVNQKLSLGGNGTLEVDAPNVVGGRFKVTDDGKVGIGITDPKEKLDVGGSLQLRAGGFAALGYGGNQIILGNGDASGCHVIKTRHSTGLGGGNAIDFYLWDPAVDQDTNKIGTRLAMTLETDRGLTVAGNLTVTGGIQQEAWITPPLQNSWVNYENGYNPAGYFKDSLGIVHLRGLVKSGTTDAAIFTLPAGYRPANRELHAAQTNNNTIGRIDILAAGEIRMISGSNGWISLDGITFRAA